jgi:hypothetical protein
VSKNKTNMTAYGRFTQGGVEAIPLRAGSGFRRFHVEDMAGDAQAAVRFDPFM